MMAASTCPTKSSRQQLASAINIVVHTARMADGTRKATGIAEVVGVENDLVEMQDIFDSAQRHQRARQGAGPFPRHRRRGPSAWTAEDLPDIHLSASIFEEEHVVKEK